MLPHNFRNLTIQERRKLINQLLSPGKENWDGIPEDSALLELADILVETAIGLLPVPGGIGRELCVNGKNYVIPMATEEPSVVAAANYGAMIVNRNGGVTAESSEALMTTQLYLENPPAHCITLLQEHETEIICQLNTKLQNMKERGGGFRSIAYRLLPELNLLRIHVIVDVCDAFGANILNTTAEFLKTYIEKLSGRKILIAILTNDIPDRLCRAFFKIPVKNLSRAGFPGPETACRIALAARVAEQDPSRAVTHNKGIMNGINALARLGSASAARAVYGGFTILEQGKAYAEQFCTDDYWPDLRILVVLVDEKTKEFSSRDAVKTCRLTSPYYASWVRDSIKIFKEAKNSLLKRDLEKLGDCMRLSYLMMFAAIFSTSPPLIYWQPESLAVIRLCASARLRGIGGWETMDAGPQVKILCLEPDVARLQALFQAGNFSCRFLVSSPGKGAVIVQKE